jgi:hypothetical protein
MTTPPMFDVPEAKPVLAPSKRVQAARAKPVWSKYRPKNPVKCDHRLAVLAETGGHGPATKQARHARKSGGQRLLLCGPHAQIQREIDGLPELKGVKK